MCTGLDDLGKETADCGEAAAPSPPGEGLSDAGVRAIQGQPDTPALPADGAEKQIIGDPVRDAQFGHEQLHDDTCAIAAQRGVIEKHTGVDPGEDALRQEAMQNGWYAPGEGTPSSKAGNLLESHGIPTWTGAGSMETLRSEMEQGHDVLAGVDAGLLWGDQEYLGGGHRVWVTGLECDESGDITGVFLNDSGNPDIGAGGRVPAGVFRDAWAARGCPMVCTLEAA